MAITLEAVYRELKRGQPTSVYYLTGDIDILKDELTTAIVHAAVDAGARDFNVDVRSAGDLDGESLHNLVETPPMLAERRAVVIRNLEQWRANASVWQMLLKYLERPSPSTVLVMTHGAGEKINPLVAAKATHVDARPLTPDQLNRWIADRAKKAGVAIEADAAQHLVAAVGSDLAAIGLELEKMAAALNPGDPVTVETVSEFVGIRRGETLSDWVDAVLRRDAPAAVTLLDIVLPQPGINGVRMGMALGTALVGCRWARGLLDEGVAPRQVSDQIFQRLKVSRFQNVGLWSEEAKRWSRTAQQWTGREIERAIAATYEADRSLKNSTVSDERSVLAALVLSLTAGSPAGAAA